MPVTVTNMTFYEHVKRALDEIMRENRDLLNNFFNDYQLNVLIYINIGLKATNKMYCTLNI